MEREERKKKKRVGWLVRTPADGEIGKRMTRLDDENE